LVGSGCSPHRLALELKKCEVRCANCHRRRTATERGWFRTLGVADGNWPLHAVESQPS
jgi:hypothetical protein